MWVNLYFPIKKNYADANKDVTFLESLGKSPKFMNLSW